MFIYVHLYMYMFSLYVIVHVYLRTISIKVYVQYRALCPGLSYLASPARLTPESVITVIIVLIMNGK